MLTKFFTAIRSRRHVVFIYAVAAVFVLFGCGAESPDTVAGGGDVATIKSLRGELRNNLNDADLRLRLARLYLREGDGAAAESHIRRALKLGTTDQQAPLDLVSSLLMQKNYFDAHVMTKSLLAESHTQTSARLWALNGEALLGINHFAKDEIRAAFVNAFRYLESKRDPNTMQRLLELSARQPIVSAARDHVRCQKKTVKLLEPLTGDSPPPSGRTLKVGPARLIKTPSQAAQEAQNGDLIEIDAGVYRGDVASWYQNDITLRGVDGIVELEANGRHERGLGIWVFEGNNITVENVSFSGAKVPHRNGAGIRLHGKGSTIRNCTFRDNENGILGSDIEDNDVIVEFSSFINNGYGDGQSHNVYIGRARSFIMRYSYSEGAHVGHLVKSRAFSNALLFNRLIDGESGDSSYVINLPEGGQAWLVGNELEQGPNSQNPVMISFGEEQTERTQHALFVVNNTFYNRVLDATFVRNSTDSEASVINNVFAGAPGIPLLGPGVTKANLQRAGPWFVDARNYDFTLTSAAPAIDGGINPVTIEGLAYAPRSEYRHPARGQERKSVGTVDIGAREFCGL